VATCSMSSRFRHSSKLIVPSSSTFCCTSCDAEELDCGSVLGSTIPRHCSGLRDSSRVPGGCIGSYSSVASVPASCRMILEPPGCEGMKEVTS